ncbi:MAG: hypothetical protein ACI4EL_06755 [Candidatus Fimimorpha sp.]
MGRKEQREAKKKLGNPAKALSHNRNHYNRFRHSGKVDKSKNVNKNRKKQGTGENAACICG